MYCQDMGWSIRLSTCSQHSAAKEAGGPASVCSHYHHLLYSALVKRVSQEVSPSTRPSLNEIQPYESLQVGSCILKVPIDQALSCCSAPFCESFAALDMARKLPGGLLISRTPSLLQAC